MNGVEAIFPVELLATLTLGGLLGFATGRTLRFFGKVLLILLGITFIFLQVLASAGFVTIDWTVVEHSLSPTLSVDGLSRLWNSTLALVTHNLPFTTGFVPALVLGLRRGRK